MHPIYIYKNDFSLSPKIMGSFMQVFIVLSKIKGAGLGQSRRDSVKALIDRKEKF